MVMTLSVRIRIGEKSLQKLNIAGSKMSEWSYYFSVILIAISLLISLRLVQNEYYKRKKEKLFHLPDNIYKTWLDIWSLTVMCIPIIWFIIVLFQPVQSICKYITSIRFYLWHLNKYLITFYQIARLQYCFSVNQIHSTKYGYSNLWFVFLYINGIGLIIFSLTLAIYYMIIPQWQYNHDIHGCIIIHGGDYPYLTMYHIISVMPFVWYYLWDWTVLLSYIIKITQFYRRKVSVPETVSNRIKYILQKILFLTIILEVSFSCSAASWGFGQRIPVQLEFIWGIIDMLLTVNIMYLMIDHNNEKYIKLIKTLHRIGIFICCNYFVENALKVYDEDNGDQENENKEQSMDTKSNKNNIPTPLHAQQNSVESKL